MPPNTNETIFPCPFSKGYGIPAQQAWLLLKVFLGYRLILAGLFITLFYSPTDVSLLGTYDSKLFIYSSQSYLMLSIISGICIAWRADKLHHASAAAHFYGHTHPDLDHACLRRH